MSTLVRENIASMQGYSWGEQPKTSTNLIKLNTNENPYPPSPNVIRALQTLDTEGLRTYPNPLADELREEVAKLNRIADENIVITNGGDEGLRLSLTTFVNPGETVCFADPSYSLYPVLAAIQGANIKPVAYSDGWEIPETFPEKIKSFDAKMSYLVNPHAPSGNFYSLGALDKIAQSAPGVLLIDEAYADFIDPSLNYQSADLLKKYDNVLILRTFSKGYSLAGIRLGYLMGSEALISPIISKTRDSYNVGSIQQRLGTAAITDQEYSKKIWKKIRENRTHLQDRLTALGLTSNPSQSNFILVEIDNQRVNAHSLYLSLKEEQIFVRYFQDDLLRNKLRITVGNEEQNESLIKAIERITR